MEIKELQIAAHWSYGVWLYVQFYFHTLFSQFSSTPRFLTLGGSSIKGKGPSKVSCMPITPVWTLIMCRFYWISGYYGIWHEQNCPFNGLHNVISHCCENHRSYRILFHASIFFVTPYWFIYLCSFHIIDCSCWPCLLHFVWFAPFNTEGHGKQNYSVNVCENGLFVI